MRPCWAIDRCGHIFRETLAHSVFDLSEEKLVSHRLPELLLALALALAARRHTGTGTVAQRHRHTRYRHNQTAPTASTELKPASISIPFLDSANNAFVIQHCNLCSRPQAGASSTTHCSMLGCCLLWWLAAAARRRSEIRDPRSAGMYELGTKTDCWR
jgi:hypothetical protein